MAKLDHPDFVDIVKRSPSFSEALRQMGCKPSGSLHRLLKNKIALLGVDVSHMSGQRWNAGCTAQSDSRVRKASVALEYPWDEVFREDCAARIGGQALLKRLIKAGKRSYHCEECGLSEWRNKRIVLQLDHINGVSNDNREENLRILCPNCHSQTDTWSGKNNRRDGGMQTQTPQKRSGNNSTVRVQVPLPACKKCGTEISKKAITGMCANCVSKNRRKSVRPKKEELARLLWETPTSVLAKNFGVTGNAVAKWCRQYGLNKPPRGYWAAQKAAA